jgi:hypothetical protein
LPQVFCFQRCSRLEARSQDTENQLEQIGHQDASLRRPLAASTPNRIFGTHSVVGATTGHLHSLRERCQAQPASVANTADRMPSAFARTRASRTRPPIVGFTVGCSLGALLQAARGP